MSKGSGDVKRAIQKCGDKPFFKKVLGWYNVGGLQKGSLLVNDINDTCVYKAEARSYFCWNGYNWDGLQSLEVGPGTALDSDLKFPEHMIVINVIAVPLFRHVSNRARPFYEYLIRYGPNDGLTLLAESYLEGAITYPSWRNDHYFRWPIYKYRMMAFMTYMVEKKGK